MDVRTWVLERLGLGPMLPQDLLRLSIDQGNDEATHRAEVLRLLDEGRIYWDASRLLGVVR